MSHEPEHEGRAPDRFEYYMVRVTRSTHEPDRVAGLIERLGSGQKRTFDTGEQLVRLVCGGFTLNQNMQSETDGRNAADAHTTTSPAGDGA